MTMQDILESFALFLGGRCDLDGAPSHVLYLPLASTSPLKVIPLPFPHQFTPILCLSPKWCALQEELCPPPSRNSTNNFLKNYLRPLTFLGINPKASHTSLLDPNTSHIFLHPRWCALALRSTHLLGGGHLALIQER
jgi:hypothetical protein